MGQLIKLKDYVSRYEQNIYLYPSRYVRLKNQQWSKLLTAWEDGDDSLFIEEKPQVVYEDWLKEDKKSLFQRVKGKFSKEEEIETPSLIESVEEENNFAPTFSSRPESEEMLKRLFINQIFHFQLRWASSTLLEKSFIEKEDYHNKHLKLFLQRMPDTFLVMFAPVFQIKKAPVEADHLLITPTAIWCIKFLEEGEQSVYLGTKENFWKVRTANEEKRILNPTISLTRTSNIVQQIFKQYEIDLPIRKAVVSENGYFDYPDVPYDIELVEKRNYDQWFTYLRTLKSPLKHVQLKAAQSLLYYCQSTSVRRTEWETTEGEN